MKRMLRTGTVAVFDATLSVAWVLPAGTAATVPKTNITGYGARVFAKPFSAFLGSDRGNGDSGTGYYVCGDRRPFTVEGYTPG